MPGLHQSRPVVGLGSHAGGPAHGGMRARFQDLTLMSWHTIGSFVWPFACGAALFFFMVVGPLLPPVCAYAELVCR